MSTLGYQLLPVADVVPSKDNPRRIQKDAPAFKEFCANVKALGVLEPVLVRPHPKMAGKYDLRAGARRHLAAVIAGHKDIPAIVKDLDDKQALQITVCENLCREDLSPMEEAAGVQSLLDAGWEARAIAANLGKSASWVSRRAALTGLTPKWRKELQKPEMSGWGAAHMELIARLPVDVQDNVLTSNCLYCNMSVKDLERELAAMTREIKRTPWPADDAGLDPKAGACAACQKRTSCRPGLFDDDGVGDEKIAKGDKCLDVQCWERKALAFLKRKRDQLVKEHGTIYLVTETYRSENELGPLVRGHMLVATKKTDKNAVWCLRVDGNGIGMVFCAKKASTSSSGKKPRPVDEDGKPKPRPLSERRVELNQRREALVNKTLSEIVEKITWEKSGLDGLQLMRLLAVFGTNENQVYPHAGDWTAFYKNNQERLVEKAWEMVRETLCRRLCWNPPLTNVPINEHEELCKLLKIDLAKLRADAAAEIPEPKSWAGLKADGSAKAAAPSKKGAKTNA